VSAFLTQLSEPLSIDEALSGPDSAHWRTAMENEYESLIKNNTWALVDRPLNRSIVSSKWLFRRKYKSDGSIARYKARFVARGFSQTEGIDYYETFSPVIKMTSLRVLLALATIHNFYVHQMDVTTAFLNGVLNEEIYITQRLGFINPDTASKVCRLHKSLYGLKQAPRVWYELFDTYLLSHGFSKCVSDTNVYIKSSDTNFILLGLYIDDLILISKDLIYLTSHKTLFSQRFSMTDNNDIEYILGIQIQRDPSSKTLIYIYRKLNILKPSLQNLIWPHTNLLLLL
jgi:hypothetical protein